MSSTRRVENGKGKGGKKRTGRNKAINRRNMKRKARKGENRQKNKLDGVTPHNGNGRL
jgi:hypothetical protein